MKKSFNDLVSLSGFKDEKGQVSGATLRLNLMSPCEADIQVKAGEGDNACKCETFYDKYKIWFKLQKNLCKVETGDMQSYVVYTLPDGICPTTVIGRRFTDTEDKTFNVAAKPENDAGAVFPCPITDKNNLLEDLEFCKRDKIYDKKRLISDGKISASMPDAEYRKWLLSASQETLKGYVYDSLKECSCPNRDCDSLITYKDRTTGSEQSIGSAYFIPSMDMVNVKVCNDEKMYLGGEPPLPIVLKYDQEKYSGSKDAKQNLDTVVVPLNILPNVDSGKPAETISVCENSWVAEKLSYISALSNKEDFEYPCITVTPDAGSMKTYSNAGFGTNFCAKSDISVMAKVESACFWGTIAVSFAAEMASLGAATPVVLYTVGSSGVVCEKLTQMKQKWPNNQF